MIKKIILITAMLMATSVWAEPDEFIKRWGMNNSVSHLTWGLEKCSNFLEESNFDCSFDWDKNTVFIKRTIFPSRVGSNFTKDDYVKISEMCSDDQFLPRYMIDHLGGLELFSMNTFLKGFFQQGSGINLPNGKSLYDSMEEWLVKNVVIEHWVIGEEVDAWRCQWKASEGKTPSISYFTREEFKKYRAAN